MNYNITNTSNRKYAQKYIKYPKFALLIITFLLAYFIFHGKTYPPLHNFFVSLGYFGTLVAGMLFAYGFTAAPATAILLILAKEQNFLVAGLIAGFGALIADLVIFKFIRSSFKDEVNKLSQEKIVQNINNHTPNSLKRYLLPVFAGFIIASPLPDEIGVTMLAASKVISMKIFSIVSYMLNTAGIFIILFIGNAI